MMNNSFIDLFSGTGAFSYVLEKNGFKCVFANDMIKESKSIYELNNSESETNSVSTTGLDTKFKLEDLNEINVEDIPKHNILCGGFPCQPFSIAGKQKGFDDKRSNVFWKIIDILKLHKPEIIILENVKNLTTHDKGNTYKVINENLTSLGYIIKAQILDTSKITNIPQHRERIYIVGFLNKELYNNFSFDFPIVENQRINKFLEDEIPDKYYYTDKLKVFDKVKENVTKHINTDTLYQYRRYYVRENKSNCCPTLTANMGGGGHNVPLLKNDKGIRKLTPRECFNLQGFPKDYKLPNVSDSALYKLAGNAVSIPVVELIVKRLT
jgi:DNA (cytosine-5)-methyltransferase 1